MTTLSPVTDPKAPTKADPHSIDQVMREPGSRFFRELRDRAAFVRVTGGFPTHLQTHMNALLNKITRYSSRPVSMDGRIAGMAVSAEHIAKLGLDEHPMIKKVQSYIAQGYVIQQSVNPKARQPYSRVRMARDGHHVTVQIDGSTIETA